MAKHRENTATWIAEAILRVQKSTAVKLNAQAQKMGRKKVIFLLGALLICFACYLANILIKALF